MNAPTMTLRQYVAWRASLPRGLFGPILPAGYEAILIVPEEPAEIAPEILTSARASMACARI